MTKGTMIFLAILLLTNSAMAADWLQWRGAKREAQISTDEIPVNWPEQLTRGWQIEVGEGHASPVMFGKDLFVFARVGEEEILRKVNAEDGTQLWATSYEAPYEVNSAARAHGKGPKSTPVISGNHIVTFGISGILTCFDTRNGKMSWQKDFSGKYSHTSPDYGTAMSPLIVDDMVIAHVGGDDEGALAAFSLASGEVKWQWSGDGPAYASPLIATFSGVKQVVTFSREHVIGVDPGTGKLLWETKFTTPWTQNCVTPLLAGGDIILSGLDQGIMRVSVGQEGDSWQVTEKWKNSDFGAYMSTPLLFDDILLVFSNKRRGLYITIDLDSGEVLWQSQGREGENAAMIRAGDVLLSLVTDGNLVIARREGNVFAPVKVYEVAETQVWSHPVVFAQSIIVKDRSKLTLWKLQ